MTLTVAVIGASGATGRELVFSAMQRGWHVQALVREAARFPSDLAARCSVVIGDVMIPGNTHRAVQGADAVIVALGTMPAARSDTARRQPTIPVCSTGTRLIAETMRECAVRRLIVISSTAVGESQHTGSFGVGWVVRRVLRDVMNDKERQDAIIRASDTDWTIVRPVVLTNGAATRRVRAAVGLPWHWWSRISRADVAEFALDCVTSADSVGRAITVSG
jgi:uncharacterized protein YbjT (DUF2867 family)